MKNVVIRDFTGGMNLREPETLKDNQFQYLKNFTYNLNQQLTTRKGFKQYFKDIPDKGYNYNACNAVTNWAVSGDANTLTVNTTRMRGTHSLRFNVTVSGTSGTLTHTPASAVSILEVNGAISFFANFSMLKADFFSYVRLQIETDSSNYIYYDILKDDLQSINDLSLYKINLSEFTQTGTINYASITKLSFQLVYTAGFTNKTAINIDQIAFYSSTSTKPIQGYYFNKDASTGRKDLFVVCGGSLYTLINNEWEVIDSGYTEQQNGNYTKWEFYAYKLAGGVAYGFCDGVNSYRSWDGKAITVYAGQPKYRYFVVQFDRIFTAGDDSKPFTLYYTNAGVTSLATLNTLSVDVGNEFDGRINGIFVLAESILVGKDDKVYYVDVGSKSALPLDNQAGLNSHRATQNVGNGILVQSKNGVEQLSQKQGTIGAQAIQGKAFALDLLPLTGTIQGEDYNNSCSLYSKDLYKYFFSFASNGAVNPNTTLVYSSLVGKAWSLYTLPTIAQYGFYEDGTGQTLPMMCSAVNGRIYQIETGYTDNNLPIEYEFITKRFDLATPSIYKTWDAVDIYGYKNVTGIITIELYVDNNLVYTVDLDDRFAESPIRSTTGVGDSSIGTEPIGGIIPLQNDALEVVPFKLRLGGVTFGVGSNLQIRGVSKSSILSFTLTQIQLSYGQNTFDIFPYQNIN